MTQRKRVKGLGLFIILLIIAGFVLLIRGCLSQYDTRFAMPPVLYFEQNGKNVVFSIVQFQNTTSYSSKGGVTHRSITAEYYIQCNDAATGQKIKDVEIAEHSDLEQYPVEVIGSSNNKAWVFIGQLLAFDPFTLEKLADVNEIENKNPLLKEKMPAERTYYEFDRASGNIMITAKDGVKWLLDTKTLTASIIDEDASNNSIEVQVKQLEALAEKYYHQGDSVYSIPNQLYSEKKISYNEYSKLRNESYKKRNIYEELRDSVQELAGMLKDKQREMKNIESEIESLSRPSISFPQMKMNSDTAGGKWFGLYSSKELDGLSDRLDYSSEYDETARRKFYVSTYAPSESGELLIDKKNVSAISNESFLHGGFLLDKQTARPVRSNGSYLIVHRDQIGREGKVLVNRLSADGKTQWSINTNLVEWMDWIFTGKQLVVIGRDHEDLSGYECNAMLIIDLGTGKMVKYDYMENM
jgi:hypothetical protein